MNVCKNYQNMIKDYDEGKLSLKQEERFIKHIMGCDDCKEELEIYYIVTYGLDENYDVKKLPDDIKSCIDSYDFKTLVDLKLRNSRPLNLSDTLTLSPFSMNFLAALIVLMAQTGSFVPAESANICIVDRIFTRVGASDDLASGQSTFMVEMTEVANILRNATAKSLIILDEIGRGTSTFDGLSIAWAVVEYIANTKILGAKTLFATHYHELTELEGTLDGVNNYCIAVKECGDDIVFLRKIIKGGADKSYGIQVAKLAGVPETVLSRAKELVAELSDADISQKAKDIAQYSKKLEKMNNQYKKINDLEDKQMSLFDTVKDDDIISDIKELDISNMTPIDALNTLYKLQGKVKNRW